MSSRFLRFDVRDVTMDGEAAANREPLLEALLARADQRFELRDWRRAAFAALSPQTPMPAIAPSILRRAIGTVSAPDAARGWVCVATPVRYVAEMSNVRLATDGLLTLRSGEAGILGADFARIWQDASFRLHAAGDMLFCVFDDLLDAATSDPEEALGLHIGEYLPSGSDAPRLRRLMSEMEMWLFDHAVNAARSSAGVPAISGLWLWGGGTAPAAAPVTGCAAGRDVFFDAFKATGGAAAGSAAPTPAVMVLPAPPGTAAWRGMQTEWLEPTLADLAAGRIGALSLSAAGYCFDVSRRWRRRFWRKPRPWPEYFRATA